MKPGDKVNHPRLKFVGFLGERVVTIPRLGEAGVILSIGEMAARVRLDSGKEWPFHVSELKVVD